MSRVGLCATLALWALFYGTERPAQAEQMTLLTTQELRAELFGVHLFGHELTSGLLFDECIEPDGLTVYRTRTNEQSAPYSQPGLLRITDTAQACFSYPPKGDPDPSCFHVLRYEEGYIFRSTQGPTRFVASQVERGVQDCPEPGLFLSRH